MGGAGVISRILGITVVCVDRVFVVVIVVSAVSLPACSCSHVQYDRRHFCSRDSFSFPFFDMFYKCSTIYL